MWQGWKPLAAELIKPSKVWSQNEKEPQLTACLPSTLGSAVNSAFQLCFLVKRDDLDLLPREPWLPLFPCLSCLSGALCHQQCRPFRNVGGSSSNKDVPQSLLIQLFFLSQLGSMFSQAMKKWVQGNTDEVCPLLSAPRGTLHSPD